MSFNIGIGGSKGKSKTSNDVTLDPWSKNQWESTAGQVKSLLGANPAKPYTGDLTAEANPYQTQAADAAKGLLSFQPGQVSAQSFKGADLSAYMNPHQQEVIDAALGDIERSRQLQRVSDAQSATAAGAWGGSRHGVADSLTNEAAQRTAASTAANLRSQGFNTAAGLFQQDAARDLAAQQTNAQLGLSGAQLGLSGAALLGNIGSDLRQGDQAGLDRLYAEFDRLQNDPFKRAALLQGLLSSTPVGWDSQGSNKFWNVSGEASGSFKYGG